MAPSNAPDAKKPDWVALLNRYWPSALKRNAQVEVAFSGGLDSTVLLDVLLKACHDIGFTLSALHVHHGLNPCADEWLLHCQAFCGEHKIPLRVEKVTVVAKGQGLEAAARKARYEVFKKSSADAVVLAHHRTDQAETFLLQALRGGGVHALSAMPICRSLTSTTVLWRPFLRISQGDLEAYAASEHLKWVEDNSNQSFQYRRNWLRYDIVPKIRQVLPDFEAHVQRATLRLGEAADFMDEVTQSDLAKSLQKNRLCLDKLKKLSYPRQKALLAKWVHVCQLGAPTEASIEEFLKQALRARNDQMPVWSLPLGRVHRYDNLLWPEVFLYPRCPAFWVYNTQTKKHSDWASVLRWKPSSSGIPLTTIQEGLLVKLPDRRVRLQTFVGHKPTKTLFQEKKIPPFLRRRWPILEDKRGRCVAIPSLGVDLDSQDANGFFPIWVPNEGGIVIQKASGSHLSRYIE